MNTDINEKKIAYWIRYSATSRIIIVGILAMLLLIPINMIKGLIYERESTKQEAILEISQKWGEQQTIVGPIISIPYKKYVINEKGERVSAVQYAHFLPETLLIDGTIEPQIRSRGIFDAVVYSSEINFSGKFAWNDIHNLGIKDADVDWSNAFISVGVSDARGIENELKLNWNNTEIEFKPGVQSNDVIRSVGNNYEAIPYEGNRLETKTLSVPSQIIMDIEQSSGISAPLPASIRNKNADGYDFSFKLNLNGSRDLQFIPVGRTTEVSLKSNWDKPSFGGAFLPDAREVTDNGFNASWKILDLNRGYPQSWLGNTYNIYSSASGVKLLAGIDGYAKATRSAKYAMLIVALTFLVFFFAEVFNRKKVHPIQYILVGLAIVLFYALLVSISEVIGFGLAYLISSIATIGLIMLYSKNVLANTKMALVQSCVLAFLYLFIYIILRLEDYAFLIGSILLFSILAVIMYLSRKIDWYAVGSERQEI
ncbi:MAG: cell envelope integrity protein CreD [Candidatus Tagabacteria bacterium CG09_land_8_20_14_0_10_41_14]|uniref:Cell envelope integrity protein CreD n=2 Tax=Candidatus Tagaibacteriota TaxID=1817918 RepID=A0A2H0WLD2_9BACT|nr:MAG: cell envelope integrity protein CreD [Candidatus Tagabacteria bacterium CG09_land_8_20_14_0_10_41_14]PJE72800.1 MAG: cell envelope integrity protein CreD [Candidatus Tagabacteria bacterium CG10_big_fil_rev_8_21_14_0_10_40_13]